MKGLGIVVNVLAVVIGGCLGDMLRGRYKRRYQELVLRLCGMVTLVVSVYGGLMAMYDFGGDKLESPGVLILVFALLTGTVFGTAFNIDGLLTRLGRVLKKWLGREAGSDGTAGHGTKGEQNKPSCPVYDPVSPRSGDLFADGFVIATVLVSFGALSVSGCMAEGTSGDTTLLYIKSAIDLVLTFALATVFGSSVSLAAFPLLIVEGIVTLLAVNHLPFMTDKLVAQMTVISAIVMLTVGINLAFEKKLKAANMIPALLIPAIYYGIVDNVTIAVENALGL